MNYLKKRRPHGLLALLLVLLGYGAHAQNRKALTLDECYALARQNYPLSKQRDLIAKSKEYTIDNASKGFLPQINLGGQATYQSDATQIPISIPGIKVPVIPKDQYKVYGEITQPLTDLALVKRQKEVQEASTSVQEGNLEVELYKLRARINQLYFGILLIDEQWQQNELLKKDIQTGIDKVTVAIQNGSDYKSNLNRLKAELLKAGQRGVELRASRRAYTDMLSLFVNQPLDHNSVLQKPALPLVSSTITRPELLVFDLQKKTYDAQYKLIAAKNIPKLALFFQGGIGRPSPVNLFKTDASPYYIGGVRLNWAISGFYTYKKERRLVDLDRSMADAQRETFLFNTNLSLRQDNAEMLKLKELLKSDDEIVELRNAVKMASATQLENGVITTNDYLKEVNAEDQARQNKLLHEIQLLMASFNYQTTSGQ